MSDLDRLITTVLHEGYTLYPYRPSALKNRRPFQFGSIAPGTQTGVECIFESSGEPEFEISARLLTPEGETEVRDLLVIAIDGSKLTITIANRTDREILSAVVLMKIRHGRFLSAHDAACNHLGLWPVLAGPRDGSTMLGLPIILDDYPQIAPESRADMFDATEIDEMLALRILTLTGAEKREMREADPRTRSLLDRVERMTAAELQSLHGTRRAQLTPGARVRLRPGPGGDVWSLVLSGRMAVVESVEEDFEGRLHIAVVVDDDPGRDLGLDRQTAHRFFFAPEELEPIA